MSFSNVCFESISENILLTARSENFAGYDPFDGLNGTLFSVFPRLKNTILGLAVTQFLKNSPFNFRPFLGVPKARNPKGVALFIMGMVETYRRTSDSSLLVSCSEIANWLIEQKSAVTEWMYPCWGYHFDWKARAFFVPKGKPNIITTVYISRALYELGCVLEREDLKQEALASADFIVNSLYSEADGRKFFAYIPGEKAFVHNASLWGAAWVAFVGSVQNNAHYKELALSIARQSVKNQNSDGSWVYGTRSHHGFIDGFHTGYNLEALHEIRSVLKTEEFDQSIEIGMQYYKKNLFEEDGTAKYYHNNRYPLDVHSAAQAIITFLKVGGSADDVAFAKRIMQKAIDDLYLPEKGHFCYQVRRHFSNKINYMRWTQAWAYYSFSMLANYLVDNDESD